MTDDLISREELLKAIDTWDKYGYTETGCFVREPKGDYVPYIHYDDVIKCIKGMSSVNPQEPCEVSEYDKDHIWYKGSQYISLRRFLEVKALEQEPKTGWNNHQIACMLADLFGDACACNYNGIDEWLPKLCDFKDTCCPNPVGVACWEQFLKYSQSRYTECGYEVRDKGALQEPKTGHWIRMKTYEKWGCSECNTVFRFTFKEHDYCPNCGADMRGEI